MENKVQLVALVQSALYKAMVDISNRIYISYFIYTGFIHSFESLVASHAPSAPLFFSRARSVSHQHAIFSLSLFLFHHLLLALPTFVCKETIFYLICAALSHLAKRAPGLSTPFGLY